MTRRPGPHGGPATAAAALAAAVVMVGPSVAVAHPAVAAATQPTGTTTSCGPAVADPLAEPPWPLRRLRPDLAWALSNGAGVRVAVVDSGVSADHPVLAGAVLPGRDFLSEGNSFQEDNGFQSEGAFQEEGTAGQCDENGHGTLIAGIIAGREAVSSGYRFHGIAPGAQIVPVRVLRDQRRSEEPELSQRIATAIRWSVDNADADVVNLSLTTPPTPQLAAAVAHAVDSGVVVVAAAGNAGETGTETGQPTFPAAYPGVIAVAGVDSDDNHVTSSTAGEFVDVSAPGIRIAGPSPAGGGYLFAEEGGTSFAAGYVSGVAALIRAYDPGLGPDEVARRITETADHPAGLWNPQLGYGVLNPVRAVGVVRPAGTEPGATAPVGLPPTGTAPSRGMAGPAALIALVGVALAALVLIAVPVVRRGRRRSWRPATDRDGHRSATSPPHQ